MAVRNKITYDTQFRFQLEPYSGISSRTTCPSCGQKNKFSSFVDVTTGERVGNDFGRCERVEHCGYIKVPTGDDIKNKTLEVNSNEVLDKFRVKDIVNLIDSKYVVKSLNGDVDNFTQFLLDNFDKEKVELILKRYRVGHITMWDSPATIFWQIDKDFDTRTGKIILYNIKTGKRIKEPFSYITWIHSPLKDNLFGDNNSFYLNQCFFGEHLLNDNPKTINVVESEKTAILCSVLNTNTYWIATGGLNNINEEKLKPFKDKELIFHPDKGKAFNEWSKKLKPFMKDYNIKISDFVEKKDELQVGEDIGDFIINNYAKNFKK